MLKGHGFKMIEGEDTKAGADGDFPRADECRDQPLNAIRARQNTKSGNRQCQRAAPEGNAFTVQTGIKRETGQHANGSVEQGSHQGKTNPGHGQETHAIHGACCWSW